MKLKKGDRIILGKNRFGDYYKNKVMSIINIDTVDDITRYYIDYNGTVRMYVYDTDIQRKIPSYVKGDMVVCDLYLKKELFKGKIGRIIDVYQSDSIKTYNFYGVQFLEKFSQQQFKLLLSDNSLIISENYIIEEVRPITIGGEVLYKGVSSGINYNSNPEEDFYNSFGVDPEDIIDKYDIVELGSGDIFTISKKHIRPLIDRNLIVFLDDYDTHIVDMYVFYNNNYEKIKRIINLHKITNLTL